MHSAMHSTVVTEMMPMVVMMMVPAIPIRMVIMRMIVMIRMCVMMVMVGVTIRIESVVSHKKTPPSSLFAAII